MTTPQTQHEGPCPFDSRLARTPYLVIPKLALQAMPMDWRERFEALLREADDAGLETPEYHVFRADNEFTHIERVDSEDPYSAIQTAFGVRSDPWANYRYGDVGKLAPGFRQHVAGEPDRSSGGHKTTTITPEGTKP